MSDGDGVAGVGGEGAPERAAESPTDPNFPTSLPGEPQVFFTVVDAGNGAKFVVMAIQSMNGVVAQVTLRPALALTIAKLLSDQAKLARSGLVIPGPNGQRRG